MTADVANDHEDVLGDLELVTFEVKKLQRLDYPDFTVFYRCN